MICCYLPCVVKSDDKYRTRFDCTVCKKAFYTVKRIESKVQVTKDSSLIFVNGTPHITCGWCKGSCRMHDSKKIRIFIRWEEIGDKYVYHPIYGRIVVKSWKPVIKTVDGCLECVYIQTVGGKTHYFNQKMRGESDIPVELGNVPGLGTDHRIQYQVVQSGVFPSGDQAGTQKIWSDQELAGEALEELFVEKPLSRTQAESDRMSNSDTSSLYGPYRDRRG